MDQIKATRSGALLIALFMISLGIVSVLSTRHQALPVHFQQQSVPRELLAKKLQVVQSSVIRKSRVSLNDIFMTSGLPCIVNFWASWCPPCIDEIPSLDRLAYSIRALKLPHLVTISVDRSANDVMGLFDTLENRPSFTVLLDPDGELARGFGTTKFPETFWISPNGAIKQRWVGPQDWLSNEVVSTLKALVDSHKQGP